MKKTAAICTVILMLSTGVITACNRGGGASDTGAVYVMTNAPSGNSILIYTHDDSGALAAAGSVDTQGNGSGSSLNPLSSQGALALTKDSKWLLTVNAGSNEISVLGVVTNSLKFTSKTSSLGQFPISLAVSGNLVFVLNQKSTPPNITAFTLDKTGTLTAVPGGVRMLPPGNYSQVGFSPNGKWLVIAGESSNLLLVYSVNGNNPSSDPFTVESKGRGPAAFAFDKNGNLIVAEAASNSVSSYSISSDGLKSITASLVNGQKTPRWIASSGNYAYTVNLGSANISSYAISTSASGQLTLLNGAAATAVGPTELAVSSNGKYLYLLDPGARIIDILQIETDGSLKPAGSVTGLFGISVQGIAAS
jgi:6-phosphogluconolactonase